jgi:glc operon protein GlcG
MPALLRRLAPARPARLSGAPRPGANIDRRQIAVVKPAGDLILFEQMQGARPIGIDLAIGKAHSAALFQESTQTLEAAINAGRSAAITAKRIQMQGGVPIHMDGTVVGAVGVSGFDKAKDVEIAETAATVVKWCYEPRSQM